MKMLVDMDIMSIESRPRLIQLILFEGGDKYMVAIVDEGVPGYDLLRGYIYVGQRVRLEVESTEFQPCEHPVPSKQTIVRAVEVREVVTHQFFETVLEELPAATEKVAVELLARCILRTVLHGPYKRVAELLREAANCVGLPLDEGDVKRALDRLEGRDRILTAA